MEIPSLKTQPQLSLKTQLSLSLSQLSQRVKHQKLVQGWIILCFLAQPSSCQQSCLMTQHVSMLTHILTKSTPAQLTRPAPSRNQRLLLQQLLRQGVMQLVMVPTPQGVSWIWRMGSSTPWGPSSQASPSPSARDTSTTKKLLGYD